MSSACLAACFLRFLCATSLSPWQATLSPAFSTPGLPRCAAWLVPPHRLASQRFGFCFSTSCSQVVLSHWLASLPSSSPPRLLGFCFSDLLAGHSLSSSPPTYCCRCGFCSSFLFLAFQPFFACYLLLHFGPCTHGCRATDIVVESLGTTMACMQCKIF